MGIPYEVEQCIALLGGAYEGFRPKGLLKSLLVSHA